MRRITLHRIPLDAFYALFDGFALPIAGAESIGWSLDDEAMLTRLWMQGVHVDDICKVIGKKSRQVIYERRKRLRLPNRWHAPVRDDDPRTKRLLPSTLASLHQELRRAM